MSVIDRDLVKAVNSGRCFVVVGSGASNEVGLPSWKNLASNAIDNFQSEIKPAEYKKIQILFDNNEFPTLFNILLNKVGKSSMQRFLTDQLNIATGNGKIYSIIANWPFSNYLTTNYDDLLDKHLKNNKDTFLTIRNTESDFKLINSESTNFIIKIHGDVTDFDNIVLTSEQYSDFIDGINRVYWRDKIMSIMNMVNIVIIGYSATDPDFKEQLERAKKLVSPDRPVFMFATGFSNDKIKEYLFEYNIRIIPYDNISGNHSELIKLLSRYNSFIAKRDGKNVGLKPVDEGEVGLAASMYLFTQLRIDESEIYLVKIYAALILQVIVTDNIKKCTKKELIEQLQNSNLITAEIDPIAFDRTLNYLYESNFIKYNMDDIIIEKLSYTISDKIRTERTLLIERFKKSCENYLLTNFPKLNNISILKIYNTMRAGLIRAFEKRGLEIARSVFANIKVDISDTPDILELINNSSKDLDKEDRIAYVDLMIEILLRPDKIMRDYLAALSQGYFSFHALGLDMSCSNERIEMAKQKGWLLDSSILLPLLAIDCLDHEYAVDLINKIRNINLSCYTTKALISELYHNAKNSIDHFDKTNEFSYDTIDIPKGSWREKKGLFVRGFLNYRIYNSNVTFEMYLKKCLGDDYERNLEECIENKLKEYNIEIIEFEKIPEFNTELEEKKKILSKEIETLRRKATTFRRIELCDAESEIVLLNKLRKYQFISHSTILNKVNEVTEIFTWAPEALYRFLTLFAKDIPSKDILHECMTHDFFYSGFEVINKDNINHIASPYIQQSRFVLETEKENYLKTLGQKNYDELIVNYENKPDYEKPLYSIQFAYFVARKELENSEIIKERMEEYKFENELKGKERKEYTKLKNKQLNKRRKHEKQVARKKSLRKKKKK